MKLSELLYLVRKAIAENGDVPFSLMVVDGAQQRDASWLDIKFIKEDEGNCAFVVMRIELKN